MIKSDYFSPLLFTKGGTNHQKRVWAPHQSASHQEKGNCSKHLNQSEFSRELDTQRSGEDGEATQRVATSGAITQPRLERQRLFRAQRSGPPNRSWDSSRPMGGWSHREDRVTANEGA